MSLLAWVILTTGLLPQGDPSSSKAESGERKPSPWARSLPALTDEEEKALDEIIDRFILYDTGKLTGDEGKKAKVDFDKLGPDATFALIRGINRAAKLEASCPTVIIATKLSKILAASDDKDLLDFAKENVGAGVKDSRHGAALADLRVMCQSRKSLLVRAKVPDPPAYSSTASSTSPPLNKLSLTDLVNTSTTAKSAQAKQAVLEIANRSGDDALVSLASVATTVSDADVKKAAREALIKSLTRLKSDALAEKMKDKLAEMRAAAAHVAESKTYHLGSELIDLLDDENADVRAAAHQSLVRLAGGKSDFGPKASGDTEARSESIKQWRVWWAKQKN